MKGYSSYLEEGACARVEGINVSYKDLSEVCGRIRRKNTDWALSFLEKAAEGEIPVLYARHNRNLGHRRELGGKKGRYPWKAAEAVLKVLRSAIANGKTKGLGESFTIVSALANKKEIYPRMASKGRQARSYLVTSRVEIVLKGGEVPKGVTVTPPKKKEEPKKEVKKEEKKTEVPVAGKEEKKAPPKLLKEEVKAEHEHKHEHEKESDRKRDKTPHEHGEYDKR